MKCWLEACETKKLNTCFGLSFESWFPTLEFELLVDYLGKACPSSSHIISNVSRVLFIVYGSYILICLFLFIQTFQKTKGGLNFEELYII